MGLILLAAFIGVPLIEIGLFIQVGDAIGLWPTLFVVIATAVTGTALLRHQGLGALARLQESLDKGEAPIDPVFDGFSLLVAGLLLLTPGFFTDTVGFLLFVPAVRKVLIRAVVQNMQVRAHGATAEGTSFHWQGPHDPGRPGPDHDIIDGEFTDVTEEEEDRTALPPDPRSGR